MYRLKLNNTEFKKYLKDRKITQRYLAKTIGVDETYVSQIVNGRSISKLCAYAVCKAISSDLEILDLFNIF